eukprot:288978-Chlamydomonas_euryale.AAC.3
MAYCIPLEVACPSFPPALNVFMHSPTQPASQHAAPPQGLRNPTPQHTHTQHAHIAKSYSHTLMSTPSDHDGQRQRVKLRHRERHARARLPQRVNHPQLHARCVEGHAAAAAAATAGARRAERGAERSGAQQRFLARRAQVQACPCNGVGMHASAPSRFVTATLPCIHASNPRHIPASPRPSSPVLCPPSPPPSLIPSHH